MPRSHTVPFSFALILLLILLALALPEASSASPLSSASGAPSGIIPEADDFATLVMGDPWDMNQSTDLMAHGIANAVFSNSTFCGTTVTNDAYVWLLHQGYPNSNNIDIHTGLFNPINSAKYHLLTFSMYRDDGNLGVPVRVYWYKAGDEVNGMPSGRSVSLTPSAGWQTYSIDLGLSSNVALGSWSGQVTGLRIDPTSTGWTNFNNKRVCFGRARLTDPSTGLRGAGTPNQTPIVTFTSPSMQSGDDYATTVLGNPWNFVDASALKDSREMASMSFGGNTLTARTAQLHSGCLSDCGDPQLWLNVPSDPAKYIDADRFKYVTIQYWQEGQQDIFAGWVARLLWTPTNFPNGTSTLLPIITRDGWPTYPSSDGYHTYQFNLKNMGLEQSTTNWGWNNSHGRIAQFRFDPTEMATPQTFHLKQVLLTADPVATGRYFTVSWNLYNPDDTATMTAYYYPQGNPSSKTLIGSATQPNNSIQWDLLNVPNGTYNIEVQAADPYNTSIWTAPVPVVVNKLAPQTIDLSPSSLDIRALSGGGLVQSNVTLNNSGATPYAWTATASLPWVSVTPNVGSNEPSQMTVTANPNGKTAGTYVGTINVNAAGVGSQSIPLTVRVTNILFNLYLPLIRH